MPLSRADVLAAHERIADKVLRTPVMRCEALSDLVGADLFFKCEHLQHTGAFKYRGASNAVAQLPKSCTAVATHSSGNHGAALAAAAQSAGIACHIVVPEGAVQSKIENMQQFGGQLHFCEPTQAAREAGLQQVLSDTGAEAIPPYDDDRIIAGQGTAALELMQQKAELDVVLAPVGGGGLVAGSCLAASGTKTKIVGAEPEGANDTALSVQQGRRIDPIKPDTIADGLRAHVGQRNFAIIQQQVAAVVTVSEAEIISAMRLLWQHLKQVVEPSSATVLAAALKSPILEGQRVGLILSGGNVDLACLPWQRGTHG